MSSMAQGLRRRKTLRRFNAFIITPAPFVKSRPLPIEEVSVGLEWDFALYPNPTRDGFFLRLPEGDPKMIFLYDLAGRKVLQQLNVTSPLHYLPVYKLALGSYWVQVSDGVNTRVKKLIIH